MTKYLIRIFSVYWAFHSYKIMLKMLYPHHTNPHSDELIPVICSNPTICYREPRDHSVYVPSQREMALQCNAISHWLGGYTEWTLRIHQYNQPSCQYDEHGAPYCHLSHTYCLTYMYSTSQKIPTQFTLLSFCYGLAPIDFTHCPLGDIQQIQD